MTARRHPLRLAVYLSRHGLGHAIRTAAVLEELADLVPFEATVVSTCDRRIWPATLDPLTSGWEDRAVDAGVLQSDDVTVDRERTAAEVASWLADAPHIVERESRWMTSGGFDLALCDVPPTAVAAARLAGIPSVALANFSWDWIYERLGLAEAAAVAARMAALADVLLAASPSAPMTAFPRQEDVGLVARRPFASRSAARRLLGVDDGDEVVLVAFQARSAPGFELPPPRPPRTWLLPEGWPAGTDRPDVRVVARDRFAEALAACDAVLGKPGYGLIGDVEAGGHRFVYVSRPGFPENAVLEEYLGERAGTQGLAATGLADGSWRRALDRVLGDAPPPARKADGAAKAAAVLARILGVVDSPGRPR